MKERLFLAINLPEGICRNLVKIQGILQKHTPPPAIKWVEDENLHLSLAFLGDVDEEKKKLTTGQLKNITFGNFSLSLSVLGGFPSLQKPRVIWVGTKGEIEKLRSLHQLIITKLDPDFPSLDKRFSPHITLGRVRFGYQIDIAPSKEVERILQQDNQFVIQRFDLMRSFLSSQGPRYEVIKKFPLE